MSVFYLFITLFILIPLTIGGFSMAPWVPTRKKDIVRFLSIITPKSGDRFLEIGCGDGRVSLSVAKTFPNIQVTGIEIAFPMYLIAKLKAVFLGLKNMRIINANAFKHDISGYDHIYVYGMPDKMQSKILPKFMSEAKKGARLYSYIFSIPKEYSDSAISIGKDGEAKFHIIEKL